MMEAPAVVEVAPIAYLNGFPKSGLHLIGLWVASFLNPASTRKNGTTDANWLGTFARHAWSTEWVNLGVFREALSRLRPGDFLRGHTGYTDDIHNALYELGIGTVFIYRDLRDVAVSQMFHILADDDSKFKGPDKDAFRALPDHEARLCAVIEGFGVYAPLFERWVLYAPWLDVDWVLKVTFEQMVNNAKPTVTLLIRYLYGVAVHNQGLGGAVVSPGVVEQMALNAIVMGRQTDRSPTFRKGKTGSWRKHFTPKVKEVFKAHAGDWLIRLGYEEDNDW